jgi:hypothetical protein
VACSTTFFVKNTALVFGNGLPSFKVPLSKPWQGIYSIINSNLEASSVLQKDCFYKVAMGERFVFGLINGYRLGF